MDVYLRTPRTHPPFFMFIPMGSTSLELCEFSTTPRFQESIPHKHPAALYLYDNRSYSHSPIFAVTGNIK